MKLIPKSVWDAVTVDGKIYAIPQYFPAKYGKKPVICQDWLDNLNLKMPTTYDELKEVAIASTKNHSDKNGKNDITELIIQQIVYGASMGAQWDSAWYNKNDKGIYPWYSFLKGSRSRLNCSQTCTKMERFTRIGQSLRARISVKTSIMENTGFGMEQPKWN